MANWLENFATSIKDVTSTVTDLVTTAQSVAGKVKGVSIPNITTTPNVQAGVEMTSSGKPGMAMAPASNTTMYIVLALVGAIIVFFLVKR